MRTLLTQSSRRLLVSTFICCVISAIDCVSNQPSNSIQAADLRIALSENRSGSEIWPSFPFLMSQTSADTERIKLLEELEQLSQTIPQLSQQKRFSEVIPLAQRAVSIQETLLGKDHPLVAIALNGLGELYYAQGLYPKAEPLYQRALKIWEQALDEDNLYVAQVLNNLAELYRAQGLYIQSEPLHQRALTIRENSLGTDHPFVATSLHNLALLYSAQGAYTKAEPLFQRSLSIFEESMGVDHLSVAEGLNGLATIYRSQGLYTQAEPLSKRAIEIQENAGVDSPNLALSLNNLASLYYAQGLYTQAESLFQRASNILKKQLGSEHPHYALSLNNLAEMYRSQGRYEQAAPLFQQALKIQESSLGSDHPDVAQSLNNLALLYMNQERYDQAELLLQQVMRIQEKSLGSNHPTFGISLNNLAGLYDFQGLYTQAEPLYQKALSLIETALGSEHPNVRVSLMNLAMLYQSQGDLTRAYSFFNRASEISEQNLDLIFSASSELRKRAYLSTLMDELDLNISASLNDAPESAPHARLALNTILRLKGRVLASLTDTVQLLRQRLDPVDRPLLDQLNTLRSQRAMLTFQGPENASLEQHQLKLEQLKTQEEALENQLARKNVDFGIENQPIQIETIQNYIPQGAALVEFIKYHPFNPKALKQEPQWEDAHYAAYLLLANGDIQWVDLGKSDAIDQAVAQFREALTSDSSRIKPVARQLDQRLMEPIRTKLSGIRQLLISPDSQLNLIPFAALVDEKDQYLVENYTITYLSSGRDLIKLQSSSQTQRQLQAPIIIADPDYQTSTGTERSPEFVARNRRSSDLNLSFDPLPGAKEEGELIHALLPNSKLLTQRQATEHALKKVQSPNILHIATHGFFLETDFRAAPVENSHRASIKIVQKTSPRSSPKNYENPLLRSGLALAGANLRQSGNEDGIFTALEATGLNLWGTQLVVLSACETGLGNVENGEGVYGLRRAFVMAGAESQVLSLWKVDDAGTKDLMVDYYQRLLNQEERGEALRQTQLEMLNSSKYSHPFYWAAFIPSGDWRSLK